jgi:hypothetical protein
MMEARTKATYLYNLSKISTLGCLSLAMLAGCGSDKSDSLDLSGAYETACLPNDSSSRIFNRLYDDLRSEIVTEHMPKEFEGSWNPTVLELRQTMIPTFASSKIRFKFSGSQSGDNTLEIRTFAKDGCQDPLFSISVEGPYMATPEELDLEDSRMFQSRAAQLDVTNAELSAKMVGISRKASSIAQQFRSRKLNMQHVGSMSLTVPLVESLAATPTGKMVSYKTPADNNMINFRWDGFQFSKDDQNNLVLNFLNILGQDYEVFHGFSMKRVKQ